MNKFTELLEKHCQWLAIGLGALFLLAMLWTYVLNQPVAVPGAHGGPPQTPGEVDQNVRNTVGKQLDEQINDTAPVVAPETSSNVKQAWVDKLGGNDRTPVQLASNWSGGIAKTVIVDKTDVEIITHPLVTQLPEVPPTLPLDKPQPKRAYVNEGAPPAAGGQQTGTDKNYVVHTFSLPIKELNDAFVTANVPPEAMTSVVSIKLMRQELGQDGVTWGAATEVKRLNNATNVNTNPIPPATATPEEVAKFLNWAAQPQSQTDIIRPAFYTIILGQGPWDPSAAVVAAANEDAEKQRLEEIRKAKREENLRKAAEDSKRRAEEARQRASQQQEPKEARPRRERSRLVDDPARPADYAGLAGMQLAQANSDAPPDFMNVPQPDPNNPAPGGPGAAPGVDALPAPAFLPSAGPATAKGWAYDDAVEEGHTYRYQVIWVIKNPVYLAGRNVIDPKHPELAQIVTISSKLDDNKWSDEVTIPTSTEYFLAGNNWQATVPAKIGIVVFKNTGGKWIDAKDDVWPGDRIGKTNGTGSFETNSVLVDIRFDARLQRAYALVLGPDGQLTERDPLKDRNDPRRKALEELVKQGTPAAGAPAASATPSPMPGM